MASVPVDWFLIVIAVIVPIVLVFMNLVIMRYFLSPEVKGHYIGRAFVIVCLLTTELTVLLLPLDVGNRSGAVGCGIWNNDCGGLDLAPVWLAIYIIIASLLVFVIPFAIFYYETDDEGLSAMQRGHKRCALMCNFANASRNICVAITYTIVTAIIAGLVLMVSWIFLSFAEIRYKSTTVSVGTIAFFNASLPIQKLVKKSELDCIAAGATCACGTGDCSFQDTWLVFQVSFVVYLAGLLSFIGWFLFVIYGGIGLIALPMDLWRSFKSRPKLLSSAEDLVRRQSLRSKARDIVDIGMKLGQEMVEYASGTHGFFDRRSRARENSSSVAKFRMMVEALEQENISYQLSRRDAYAKYYNPLAPYCSLCMAIACVVVTVVWILHVFLYMAVDPPLTIFMNEFFRYFENTFSLVATVGLAIFCMYLLLATIKGAFKFGSRFLLCNVHPMIRKSTYLNGFYFNMALVLLCVLPVVQFCIEAFDVYVRQTDAAVIFGSQIRNIRFFRYFYQFNVFIYALLAMIALSCIYFACARGDTQYVKDLVDQAKRDFDKSSKDAASKLAARGGALGGLSLASSVAAARGAGTVAAAAGRVREW